MALVVVELPRLLRDVTGLPSTLDVEADTLEDALARLVAQHPSLGVHVRDETGDLREHVLCLHNGANTRWLDRTRVELADGDRLTIMQAVSGG